MKLKLTCPACNRDDQFIQAEHLHRETSDDTLIACACGASTALGTLKANCLTTDTVAQEAERLASEAARRAFGQLLK